MKILLYKDQLNPDIATTLNNIGSTQEKLGNHESALKYYEDALEMLK